MKVETAKYKTWIPWSTALAENSEKHSAALQNELRKVFGRSPFIVWKDPKQFAYRRYILHNKRLKLKEQKHLVSFVQGMNSVA